MKRYIASTLMFLGSALYFLISVPELRAPEITEPDIFRYHAYHVAESGAILDTDGVIMGWFQDNAVYDTNWNIRYRVQGIRICRAEGD